MLGDFVMNRQTFNVCGLGISSLLVFSGYFALQDLQKTLLLNAHDDNPDFDVDGYTFSGVVYTSFAISVFFAPSVISSIGPRLTMFIGAALFAVPPITIFLESTSLYYMAGALSGIGNALNATAVSNYLVLNSSEQTLARNTALYWFLYQSGMFPGNLFVYFEFEHVTLKIDEATRTLILLVMAGVIAMGACMYLILLRKVDEDEKETTTEKKDDGSDTPLSALKKTWEIASSRTTAILVFTFGYCGLHYSLIYGIYGSSVGFTLRIGEGVKRLVPLSTIFIGFGDVSGGLLMKAFGDSKVFRNNLLFALAVILNFIGYLIIFLSLPANANFGNTYGRAFIEPRIWLLLLASYFFGLGDGFLNIQMYTLLGSLYPKDSAPAFSVFKILRTAFAATSFYYSRYLPLHTQLFISTIVGILGYISFNVINVAHERRKTAVKS